MANYEYITIPVSRLTEEWLEENNFSYIYDVSTFVSYHTQLRKYDHFNEVEAAHREFICNTQEEFIQKVNESRLMGML